MRGFFVAMMLMRIAIREEQVRENREMVLREVTGPPSDFLEL
jgi:hypothetical protein